MMWIEMCGVVCGWLEVWMGRVRLVGGGWWVQRSNGSETGREEPVFARWIKALRWLKAL